ncbi:hypothetical protein [Micromonospora inaquosa]|uniref:hypothetical protein n=1 Tax=Micromonospora inaquosa TaxID=2203716 RepID=UPI000F5F5F8F|nr:hypothetical protein [Micromonospora inaquosa]
MSKEQDIRRRMADLASSLLAATLEGRIQWSTTDDEDQYLYAGSKSSVLIEQDLHHSRWNHKLAILNTRGTEVESIADDWDTNSVPPQPDPVNIILEQLFDASRRQALGVDDLLDSAMHDIERGYTKPVPPKPQHPFDEEPPF